MLTNPNTCGLFERDIAVIARILHDTGIQLYYDGANLNAIMDIARPGDMDFDVVHLNLHQAMTTSHGGGPGTKCARSGGNTAQHPIMREIEESPVTITTAPHETLVSRIDDTRAGGRRSTAPTCARWPGRNNVNASCGARLPCCSRP
jgi:hypothetical protein